MLSGILVPKIVAQQPFTCEDQFFLTLSSNTPSLNEVIIDPITNAVVFQSINANLAVNVNAAGYRSTDNYIYCINPSNGALVRLDANGQATILKYLPLNLNRSYFAGDITPDGRYLVLIGSSPSPSGMVVAADMVKVDLEDINYGISTTSINVVAQIFDIAFHPETDRLYGYDSGTQRLLEINPQTGAVSFNWPTSNVPVATGSLFFDAYGNLFAYGSVDATSDQNSLYQIDLQTGASRFLIQGQSASSSDGCSCPYTVELSKTVMPEQAFPCTEVEYTFTIVNSSRRLQLGLRLEDNLPPGFTFVRVSSNPVGGDVLSQAGDATFILDNFSLQAGRYEIKIIVNTGNVSPGLYRNQARLLNLPASLGSSRVSDNPRTVVLNDSTTVAIQGFSFDTIFVDQTICAGTSFIRLDASLYTNGANTTPAKYFWEDGSTLPYLDVNQVGEYLVTLAKGCDTAFVHYTVVASSIDVEILTQDMQTIPLGDSLRLESIVSNTASQNIIRWLDPQPGSLRCPDCLDTWARPFNDIEYTLVVENELGCRDSADIRIFIFKNKNVYFPNVLMPQTSINENNGYFYPSGDIYTLVSNLSVYTRWGELVFEARNISVNDMTAGWDGTYNGRIMPPGVYTWVAKILFLDGESFTYYGDVTLVR